MTKTEDSNFLFVSQQDRAISKFQVDFNDDMDLNTIQLFVADDPQNLLPVASDLTVTLDGPMGEFQLDKSTTNREFSFFVKSTDDNWWTTYTWSERSVDASGWKYWNRCDFVFSYVANGDPITFLNQYPDPDDSLYWYWA